VSILFSDIRGFTRMSATMEPDDVLDMLNAYFAALVEAIFRCEGTVDKIYRRRDSGGIRESLTPIRSITGRRCTRPLAMQESGAESLNGERKARNQPTLRKSGLAFTRATSCTVFVGTQERLEFTVVGDAVKPRLALSAPLREPTKLS